MGGLELGLVAVLGLCPKIRIYAKNADGGEVGAVGSFPVRYGTGDYDNCRKNRKKWLLRGAAGAIDLEARAVLWPGFAEKVPIPAL